MLKNLSYIYIDISEQNNLSTYSIIILLSYFIMWDSYRQCPFRVWVETSFWLGLQFYRNYTSEFDHEG